MTLGTPEHAKSLIKEMNLKWEGMESPLAFNNPWETVSRHGQQAGKNLGINGPVSRIGTPDDPFTPKFGPYHHPPRGIPPVNHYNTFLFDQKHPFRRAAPSNPQEDMSKPPDGLWHPYYGATPRDVSKFPSVVVPIPRPMRTSESNHRVPENPKDWLYEPLPYRAHISRPDSLPEKRGVRPMSYEYPEFHMLNPRSAFQRPSPRLTQSQAQAALGSMRFSTRHQEKDGGEYDHEKRTFRFTTQHGHEGRSTSHGADHHGFTSPLLLEEGEDVKTKLHQHIMERARSGHSKRTARHTAEDEEEKKEENDDQKEDGEPAAHDTIKGPRSFRFTEVLHKTSEKGPWGFYPLGRKGPQLLHGPPSHRRSWDTSDYDEAAKRFGQRSVRESSLGSASLSERMVRGDPGPYGHYYTHQAGPPTEGRSVVIHTGSAAAPSKIPEEEKDDNKMTDEPPFNDDNAIAAGPTAEGRSFPAPGETKVDRVKDESVMKKEDFPQFYKGTEEAEVEGKDKPRVDAHEEEKKTSLLEEEEEKNEEKEEKEETPLEKEKEQNHYLKEMIERRRHKIVHPVFQETAAHVGKPKHKLKYEIPWTKHAVPTAHGPPSQTVSVELQVPSANLDVSLIEDIAQLTEDDFSKPWWERDSGRHANDKRLNLHSDGSPPLSDGIPKEAQEHPWKAMEHVKKALGDKVPRFKEVPLPNHDIALHGNSKGPSEMHPVQLHKVTTVHKDGKVSWRFEEVQDKNAKSLSASSLLNGEENNVAAPKMYDSAPSVPMASVVSQQASQASQASGDAPNFLENAETLPHPNTQLSEPEMRLSPSAEHVSHISSGSGDLPPIIVAA